MTIPNVDPTRVVSNYVNAQLKEESDYLRPIIEQHLQNPPETRVILAAASKKAEELAKNAHISIDSPGFQVIFNAVNDFEIARNRAKAEEADIFSINPTPPEYVTPVPDRKIDSLKSTMFTQSARTGEELLLINKALPTLAIRQLISFKPKRIALHELTRFLLLNFRIPPDQELDAFLASKMPKVLNAFLAKNLHFETEVNSLKNRMEKEVFNYLKNGAELDEKLQKLVEQVESQATKPQPVTDEYYQGIAMRVADLVVKSYVKDRVNHFDFSPVCGELSPLPRQTTQTRRCYMINGGIASGKGTAEERIKKEALQNGVDLSDALKINNDSFKKMLLSPDDLSPDDRPYFSRLAHDEASMIRESVLNEYQERLKQDEAPHLYVDQVWPGYDVIDMLGNMNQNGVDLTVVQIPVERSFKMAFARGVKTGRFENRPEIISTHKNVPTEIIKTMKKAAVNGKTNVRITILENIAPDEVQVIGKFDLQNKTMTIHNPQALDGFFLKTQLQTNAKNFKELYPPNVSLQDAKSKENEFLEIFTVT